MKFPKSPKLFLENILRVKTLEIYQIEALEKIAKHQRIAIAACHDLGKSFLLAHVVLWYLSCFPKSKIITTAPTYNQVKNILWSEIRAAYGKSFIKLGGQMNLTEWKLDDDWFALGFSPQNELTGGEGQGTASSFQGFHAHGGLLLIFDEATGVKPNIWTMAEGLLTQANVKFVAIGNPTSRASNFYRCFSSPMWAKIYLSCFDSPNLKANGIDTLDKLKSEIDLLRTLSQEDALARVAGYKIVKPYLLSTAWVVQKAMEWGIDHPLTQSKILGAFPEEGENVLITLGTVEEAQLRVYYPTQSDRKTIGVDVARFGIDKTVITGLHGFKFQGRKTLAKRDIVQVTGEVLNFYKEFPADVIVVDGTGLGSGVVDNLREAQRSKIIDSRVEIRDVQFGAAIECNKPACEHKECDKARYYNLKARMFGLLGQDLKDGLTLPDDDVFLDELPTILYSYDSKGRMIIESKDEYKKRTGRASPDVADSLALANFGRYDELKIGRMSAATHLDSRPTLAGSLGASRSW